MAAPLVLLTGATGFVGRQVLRALGERGCRVRAVVREGKQGQIAAGAIASPDIFAENAAWWTEACRGVDTIIHAAWYAEPGQCREGLGFRLRIGRRRFERRRDA